MLTLEREVGSAKDNNVTNGLMTHFVMALAFRESCQADLANKYHERK
jgi:hypothetical protein